MRVLDAHASMARFLMLIARCFPLGSACGRGASKEPREQRRSDRVCELSEYVVSAIFAQGSGVVKGGAKLPARLWTQPGRMKSPDYSAAKQKFNQKYELVEKAGALLGEGILSRVWTSEREREGGRPG